MARWLVNVMTIVCLRWSNGTTVQWQCCNGTIALRQWMTMMLWQWNDGLLHHRHRVFAPSLPLHRNIALSTILHIYCLKKMAAKFLCSLKLFWCNFNYETNQACLFVMNWKFIYIFYLQCLLIIIEDKSFWT